MHSNLIVEKKLREKEEKEIETIESSDAIQICICNRVKAETLDPVLMIKNYFLSIMFSFCCGYLTSTKWMNNWNVLDLLWM